MLLALFRLILLALYMIYVFVFTLGLSIIRPLHKNNTHIIGRLCARFHTILGLKVIIRGQENIPTESQAIYICNHQSNLDLFTVAYAVPKNTITIGKKSILYIPVFGIVYALSGSIFIERKNHEKAISTFKQTAKKVISKKVSVWVFAEGHRNLGRGLLPFKMGAFHLAQDTHLPLVPICASDYYKNFSFKKWNNGVIYIDFLKPVDLSGQTKEQLKQSAQLIHDDMEKHIKTIS